MIKRLIYGLLIILCCMACAPVNTPPPATPTIEMGRPLKGSRPAVYRLMADGRLRHIVDWPTYLSLGYQPEDIIMVADETLAAYLLDLPLTPWLTGSKDTSIYLLKDGRRYRLPDMATFAALGGDALDISLVTDDFLAQFPLAADPLTPLTLSTDETAHPQPTAARWVNGYLFTANQTGLLTRWDTHAGVYRQYHLPGDPVIETMAADGSTLYLGTATGGVWQLAADGSPIPIVAENGGWVSTLTVDGDTLWYADVNHLDQHGAGYRLGRGLVRRAPNGQEAVFNIFEEARDPLKNITALAVDSAGALWVGTRFAGVWRYNPAANAWQSYTSFNSGLDDNAIADLRLGPDGALWVATRSGVSRYQNETWENYPLAEGLTEQGALSLALTGDNTVWVAGDHYLARGGPGRPWLVYTALDHPLLAELFSFVVLDDTGPWFIGRQRKIHFDGHVWTAYDSDVRRLAEFTPGQMPDTGTVPPPLDFPDPIQDYTGWLKTWPRPANDNGRGLHFLQTHWFDEIETQKQINRMQKLGVRWVLVNYANRYQLMRTAPMFQEAGIMVVWRPFVRPYESYAHWADDVTFLRGRGIAPYIQLYNEPSLAQEWDQAHPIDQETYLSNLLPAIRQVYDAGGYIGLQSIDPGWLRVTLQRMKTEGLADVFDRLFFVPHPYGLNHPPDYAEDINGVLGFRDYARIFQDEIGFVPVMIAGEGGWRPGEAQDNRYPAVSEELHRDYHLAVFNWFRAGQLSNGEPLPDYLFAFCPWLISDPHDPAAWFDSASGDRVLTIQAVEAMPSFERKFSWDK